MSVHVHQYADIFTYRLGTGGDCKCDVLLLGSKLAVALQHLAIFCYLFTVLSKRTNGVFIF